MCALVGFSQTELLVQSNGKGLYINHTVTPKENFYSVGRLYNISPKDIAAFNKLDMNNGLNVGQTIMIPLEANNFSQKSAKGVPVYYVVGDKEGLYRVSLKNNNVLMANLRKWNHLTNDNITTGSKLIVGYLVSSENPNTIAKANNNATNNTTVVESQPAAPANTNNTVTTNTNTVSAPPKAEKPAEPKKEETRIVPATNPPANNPTPVNNPVPANTADAGFFKSVYEQQIRTYPPSKDMTATSGIFKTASGWQDGKYYALLDGVEPGTIVRIINPANNKAIYAKVLGQMTGIRQNQGLDLRMSNAGADALGVADSDKFIVRVIY